MMAVLSLNAFAGKVPTFTIKPSQQKALTAPGYCQIEVNNRSSKSAIVDIYYDDSPGYRNNVVQPGYSMYVDLYYGGYCHNRAYLVISTPESYLLYAKYTGVHGVVDVFNKLKDTIAAELKA